MPMRRHDIDMALFRSSMPAELPTILSFLCVCFFIIFFFVRALTCLRIFWVHMVRDLYLKQLATLSLISVQTTETAM